MLQRFQPHIRGQQDEDAGQQQRRRLLLEAVDLGVRRQVRIGDDQPHHRHCQQARFMQHGIGQRKDRQHQHEKHRHLHVFRHQRAAEGRDHHQRGTVTQKGGEDDALADNPDRMGRRQLLLDDHDHDKRPHGNKRADRIVDDGLPLQKLGRAVVQLGGAQQRRDHGRAGHDHDPAEDDRALPAEPGDPIKRRRRQQPAKRRAQHHQPPHTGARILKLAEVQRQPALEQDHRHGQRDHRRHQRADIARGHEDPGQRPQDQPGQQHHDDARQPEPPGQPLRADTDDAHKRKCLNRAQPAFGGYCHACSLVQSTPTDAGLILFLICRNEMRQFFDKIDE